MCQKISWRATFQVDDFCLAGEIGIRPKGRAVALLQSQGFPYFPLF